MKLDAGEAEMKAVIAIDSFKGSMTSMQAGNAAKKGILAAHPEARVIVCPIADGGEGTTDALIEGLGGEKTELMVTGPLGIKVKGYYGWLPERRMAVMEMASAAGITLVKEKDPLRASTRGVGEMIVDALERGCRDFIVGIGGSATNDGGIGMLKALGYTFTDENGADVGDGAQALGRVSQICADGKNSLLEHARFQIACDVINPLCGEQGATYIFGPQKGVTEEMKQPLDDAMAHYAKTAERYFHCCTAEVAGAGAAGGLGFAFLTFLNGTLVPGVDLVLQVTGLEKELQDADFAVTGEGRLDGQSIMGKAPVGVAELAKKYGVKTIAFAGSVTEDAKCCNEAGIDAFFPIVRGVTTLDEAIRTETAEQNMTSAVEQVFRLL